MPPDEFAGGNMMPAGAGVASGGALADVRVTSNGGLIYLGPNLVNEIYGAAARIVFPAINEDKFKSPGILLRLRAVLQAIVDLPSAD